MKLFIRIGIGVSIALNVFVFIVAAYGLLTQEKRISENRSYMDKVIESEVIKQIKFMMPSSTGTVVKLQYHIYEQFIIIMLLYLTFLYPIGNSMNVV